MADSDALHRHTVTFAGSWLPREDMEKLFWNGGLTDEDRTRLYCLSQGLQELYRPLMAAMVAVCDATREKGERLAQMSWSGGYSAGYEKGYLQGLAEAKADRS